MSKHTVTFDPDAGVAYGANLNINAGSTFNGDFTVVKPSGTAFSFDGWTGSSQIVKSVSVGSTTVAAGTFTVGFTSAVDGKFRISMGSTATSTLAPGRYVYDVEVTRTSDSVVTRVIEGIITVRPNVTV